MLYKPSNPSPYNSVVDYNTDNLAFTASCISTSDIGDMRLAIKDDSCEYYLPLSSSRMLADCISSSGIHFPATDSNLDSTLGVSKGYKIATSNYTRTPLSNDTTIKGISDIIKPLKQYRWQVRLYEKSENPEINIGYGFVQSVITTYDTSRNKQLKRILKVRPHTNMFAKKGENDDYNTDFRGRLTAYYDNKVNYALKLNGETYAVQDYYYQKDNAYTDSSGTTKSLTVEKQYEEPLFAFIEIDLKTGDSEIETGTEYTILTNYIDSNEYYFECRQAGNVTFTDRQNATVEFTDGLTPSTEKIFPLGYSNFKLTGTYNPNGNGASVNYYRFMLYEVAGNGNETLLNDTGNIYRSDIVYEYDDFFAGKTYKLVTNITDTNRKTIVKSVLIKPSYNMVSEPIELDISYYPENKSILIDTSNFISISGVEKVQGAHDGYIIEKCEYDPETDSWIISENSPDSESEIILSETTEDKSYGLCHIHPNNSISYSQTDLGKDLICHNPLLSIVFKVSDGDKNRIFKFTDDDGYTHTLDWNNCNFYYEVNSTWSSTRIHFTPFTKNYRSYTISDVESCVKEISKALTDKEANYTVPYLAYEDVRTGTKNEKEEGAGNGLYMHIESIARDHWWHFVLANKKIYIRCLDVPDGVSNETVTYKQNEFK